MSDFVSRSELEELIGHLARRIDSCDERDRYLVGLVTAAARAQELQQMELRALESAVGSALLRLAGAGALESLRRLPMTRWCVDRFAALDGAFESRTCCVDESAARALSVALDAELPARLCDRPSFLAQELEVLATSSEGVLFFVDSRTCHDAL